MSRYNEYDAVLRGLGAVEVGHDKTGFTRSLSLDCLGTTVRFELYANLCNAYIGGSDIQVVCSSIAVDGCWPNRYKRNINLRDDAGNLLCAIPIERYQNDAATTKDPTK